MLSLLIAGIAGLGVIENAPEPIPPLPIIYDTDMGNDVDDGYALGMIHALASRGECELLAVTVTKDHELAGPFVDVLNTFYGHGDIPIGVVRNGPEPHEGKFLGLAAEKRGDSYRYPHDLLSGNDAPDATTLLRKTLASQADGSVVIVQVGFSTNLARLLDSPADDISPLTGRELAEKKVKVISVMAGAFEPHNDKPHREYNVALDVPAAQRLTTDWPTPIIYSGFEVGIKTRLPKMAIMHDFDYVPDHPMAAANRLYNNKYNSQPSWDLTSVLWAVRPDRGYFGLSEKGRVFYDAQGFTTWTPDPEGTHQYLTVDALQAERVKENMTTLASEAPHCATQR